MCPCLLASMPISYGTPCLLVVDAPRPLRRSASRCLRRQRLAACRLGHTASSYKQCPDHASDIEPFSSTFSHTRLWCTLLLCCSPAPCALSVTLLWSACRKRKVANAFGPFQAGAHRGPGPRSADHTRAQAGACCSRCTLHTCCTTAGGRPGHCTSLLWTNDPNRGSSANLSTSSLTPTFITALQHQKCDLVYPSHWP